MYNLFLIRHIDCSLNGQSCPEEINEKLNKYIGSDVLIVNQKQLIQSVKSLQPIEKVSIGFKVFNTFKITLEGGSPPITADVFLVRDLPAVSMDIAPVSSSSAEWPSPVTEIEMFSRTASSSGFNLWENGLMTPDATTGSAIKYIISEKPDTEVVKSVYRLIKLVYKYLDTQSIQVVGQRVFLSQTGEPDIIVSVPFDESEVTEALKSLSYLETIKKDAKVIDLRFKNPIIR